MNFRSAEEQRFSNTSVRAIAALSHTMGAQENSQVT